MKKVIVAWSGGKDSCFAAYKALLQGYKLKYLVNTVSVEFNRVGLHGVAAELIKQQAQLIGVPLFQKAVRGVTYAEEFKRQLAYKRKVVDGVVFGDIYLEQCRSRNERICKELNLLLIEPLWGRTSADILRDFIRSGFEAYVVSTQGNLLGKEWVGRKLDYAFLSDIQKLPTIDICGENGEYHTFVTNGPFFKKKIMIRKTDKIFRNDYWFLDIQDYKLVDKQKGVFYE